MNEPHTLKNTVSPTLLEFLCSRAFCEGPQPAGLLGWGSPRPGIFRLSWPLALGEGGTSRSPDRGPGCLSPATLPASASCIPSSVIRSMITVMLGKNSTTLFQILFMSPSLFPQGHPLPHSSADCVRPSGSFLRVSLWTVSLLCSFRSLSSCAASAPTAAPSPEVQFGSFPPCSD